MNKNTKFRKVIIIIAIILIPIIYSFFYLKAYWDPYANLEDLKIGMVNLDEAVDGVNNGKELINELIEKKVVTVCEVTSEQASVGLESSDYYAVITIPSDFTKALNSAGENEKTKATLLYTPNKKSNYLASQILNSVVNTTELALQEKISGKVVENLSDALEEVPGSLKTISDATDEILDGTTTLSDNIGIVDNGLATLNAKYKEFDNGITTATETLSTGVDKISTSIDGLSQGTAKLDDTIAKIETGATELKVNGATGVAELTNGISNLNTNTETLDTYITGYVSGVNELDANMKNILENIVKYGDAHQVELAQDKELSTIYETSKKVLDSRKIDEITANGKKIELFSNGVFAGTTNLLQNTSSLGDLANGIDSLTSVISQVRLGSEKLNTSVTSLKNGLAKISGQSGTLVLDLTDASTKIRNSLSKLNTGTEGLYSGSRTLVDGVKTFKEQIDLRTLEINDNLAKLDGLSDYVEEPVEIVEQEYGEVNEYGIAFTPLFLSIGLWVGSLMAYVGLYCDQDNRFKLLGRNAENKILQNLLYLAIAGVQGILLAVILKLGLGFVVNNIWLYYFACILIAITCMSVIQFLIRNFGEVGKFLALIILIAQLCASGGTFPIEVVNKAFHWLNPILPMTYAIDLVKEALLLTQKSHVVKYSLILIGINLACILITMLVDVIRKKKNKIK